MAQEFSIHVMKVLYLLIFLIPMAIELSFFSTSETTSPCRPNLLRSHDSRTFENRVEMVGGQVGELFNRA